jgi:hypothetical protein
MQKQKNKENSSGNIHFDHDKIFWGYQEKNIIEIDLNDISIIGEYTNSDGPWFDDWFLTFVTKDGQWQSIPWYADNIDQLTQVLCNKFQSDLNGSFLTGSTNWDSVIRHPTHLKNKTLFKLTPTEYYKEPKTLLDKLLSSIGVGNFDTTKYVELTDEVKNELTNANR